MMALHWPLPCRLALADLRHARIATLCQVIGLAALLVPLLILFGIKNGVIADRTAALLRNPEDLRINISGQEMFTAAFVAELSRDQDVRFAGPHPIQLAVLADMAVPADGGAVAKRVTLLATGPGDPYLPDGAAPPQTGEIALSASLAGALGVVPGDPVELLLPPRENAPDGGFMTARVTVSLPASTWGRDGALMAVDDLFLIQDWGNGDIAVSNLDDVRGQRPTAAQFPLLRLYATDVDAAFRLVDGLAAKGYATGASLDKARTLVALRTALDTGFLTVATAGLIGVTATFAASLWSAVTRNRRSISLLRLGGLARRSAILLPVTQALTIGCAGWLFSMAIYAALSGLLDLTLGATFGVTDSLARISTTEVCASGIATLIVSILAAVGAAIAVTGITPEEGFADAA